MVTVQFVLLSHCHLIYVVCSLLCYNCFMFFNYPFYVCFLGLYVLLSISCVLCFCIVSRIVSPHVHNCLFSICLQYYQLSPGGNPSAVNKYIISYNTQYVYSCTYLDTNIYTRARTLARKYTHRLMNGLSENNCQQYIRGWHSQLNACVTSEREYP